MTVHPFEDGNGRIGRAIADLALARAEGSPQRFYSMSAQIRVEREGYYAILERTQKSGLDITAWLDWFLDCLDRGVSDADFLLDGFEGHLLTSKWAKVTKVSTDTAMRDITDLVSKGRLAAGENGGAAQTMC